MLKHYFELRRRCMDLADKLRDLVDDIGTLLVWVLYWGALVVVIWALLHGPAQPQ